MRNRMRSEMNIFWIAKKLWLTQLLGKTKSISTASFMSQTFLCTLQVHLENQSYHLDLHRQHHRRMVSSYWVTAVYYLATCTVVCIISPWAISLHQLWTGSGLVIHTELIYEYTICKCPIPRQEHQAEEGGLIIHHGLIIRIYRCISYRMVRM